MSSYAFIGPGPGQDDEDYWDGDDDYNDGPGD